LALQTDDEAQQEILALKAKLRAAEATIAELTAKARRPESHTEASSFEDSRFPLFRKAQSQAMAGWGKLWGEPEDKLTTPPDTGRNQASDGHLAYLASEEQRMAAEEKASNASVEQIFQRYDADNSGQIDLEEFRQFLQDMSRGVIEAIPSLPEFDFSVEEEGRRFGEWSKETYGTAESMAYETAEKTAETLKGTAQSVVNAVQGLGAAAAASMPGAPAAVPLTLIGGVGSGYKELLASGQAAQVPVLELITAVERQARLSMELGGFMQLIVKLDEGNMRAVRQAWEKHGRPLTVRELLQAEVAAGVQEPTRLKEGSAALSLLWSMRAKRFWTIVADGFADQESTESSSAFGLRAYEATLEPYHAFIIKNTFRTGFRALPSRKEMLGKMAAMPSESMGLDARWPRWRESAAAGEELTAEERMAACLVELKECSEATKRVTNMVQAELDELGLRDDRKL